MLSKVDICGLIVHCGNPIRMNLLIGVSHREDRVTMLTGDGDMVLKGHGGIEQEE
jgi:hypothetical protein